EVESTPESRLLVAIMERALKDRGGYDLNLGNDLRAIEREKADAAAWFDSDAGRLLRCAVRRTIVHGADACFAFRDRSSASGCAWLRTNSVSSAVRRRTTPYPCQPRRRGSHRGTFAQYASHSAPKVALSSGSSWRRATRVKTKTRSTGCRKGTTSRKSGAGRTMIDVRAPKTGSRTRRYTPVTTG